MWPFTVLFGRGLGGLVGESDDDDDRSSLAFSTGEALSFRRSPTRGGVGPLEVGSTDFGRYLGRAEPLGLGLRLARRVREISEVRSATFERPSSADGPAIFDEERV